MSGEAAVLVFPAASLAPPAGTPTATVPALDGVTVKVYAAPEPESPDLPPPATVTSASVKPVTLSENVAVTVKALFVGFGARVLSTTLGRVASYARVSCVATVLPLPAASVALPAGRSTVTGLPDTEGVTVK